MHQLGVQGLQDALGQAADHAADDAGDELRDKAGLQLPAILDLKAAGELAAALLERRGADIVLDAAGVQRLGGQCLQILLSARQSWAEDGCQMRVMNASPEFCAAAELFGTATKLFYNQREIA